MRQTTLTIGLGVAAVAAVALAPRLQGLLVQTPVETHTWIPVDPEPTVQVVSVPEHPPAKVPVRETGGLHPAFQPVAQASPRPAAVLPPAIAEVDEPLPGPTTVPVDGVIEMKTGGNGHQDTLPELGTAPSQEVVQEFWDNCPACGMG